VVKNPEFRLSTCFNPGLFMRGTNIYSVEAQILPDQHCLSKKPLSDSPQQWVSSTLKMMSRNSAAIMRAIDLIFAPQPLKSISHRKTMTRHIWDMQRSKK